MTGERDLDLGLCLCHLGLFLIGDRDLDRLYLGRAPESNLSSQFIGDLDLDLLKFCLGLKGDLDLLLPPNGDLDLFLRSGGDLICFCGKSDLITPLGDLECPTFLALASFILALASLILFLASRGLGGGEGDKDTDDPDGDLDLTVSASFDLTALTSTGIGDLCMGEGDFSNVDSIRIGENLFTALGGLFSIVLCIGEGTKSNLSLMSIGEGDLDLDSESLSRE